jgi:hypothetical protein
MDRHDDKLASHLFGRLEAPLIADLIAESGEGHSFLKSHPSFAPAKRANVAHAVEQQLLSAIPGLPNA